ncbi:MAG: MmcQ/YjbR family DNA-binding protein [Clostridiales bacterium]|nr:MmcQ/YjbR family DNA-binding protein [Clostridiales bacterium]
MNRRELIDYCLTYPDAYEDYPFHDSPDIAGAWTVMRHGLNKKGFAFIYERGGLRVNLKSEPERGDFLRQVYSGVKPAYHMNKNHWITVCVNSDVPVEVLHGMIDRSYKLTMNKNKRGK